MWLHAREAIETNGSDHTWAPSFFTPYLLSEKAMQPTTHLDIAFIAAAS